MLVHPASSQGYNGITIVLDKASRFDTKTLISGQPRDYVQAALAPINLDACCLITSDLLNTRPYINNTRLIIGLGPTPLIEDGVTLQEIRGYPTTYKGITVINSFAPQDAFDRRDYFADEGNEENDGNENESETAKTHGKTKRKNWKFWLRKDLQKCARIYNIPSLLTVYSNPVILYPAFNEVVDFLMSGVGITLYLDIETTYDMLLTCVGVSFGAEIMVIPFFQTQKGDTLYYENSHRILAALCRAMSCNTCVIHNSSFDLFVLCWRYGILLPSNIFDTMLAHQRCHPEVEKSLGHCLAYYTYLPYHKNEVIVEPRSNDQAYQLYQYNAKDIQALIALKPAIESESLKTKACNSIAFANSLIKPLLTVSLTGLRYDSAKRDSMMNENLALAEQYHRMLSILIGYDINPRSSQQVCKYLYEDLKLCAKPEEDATNEKTLLQLQLKRNLLSIKLILMSRGVLKQNSQMGFKNWYCPTFKEYLAADNTTAEPRIESKHRLTTTYHVGRTVTLRLSATKVLRRFGTNAQNWDKSLRKIFIPDEGKIFGQVDQAGAEALVVAYLCRPGNFRNLFLNGIKSHVYVALHNYIKQWNDHLGYSIDDMLELPLRELTQDRRWKEVDRLIKSSDDWPAERRYYFIAKMICHACNYGMKAPTFRINVLQKSEGRIVLTLKDACNNLDKYHALFPEIRDWHKVIEQEVTTRRLLRNLFGHPRIFTGHLEHSTFKEAYAFIPQSTVGIIGSRCLRDIQCLVDGGDSLFIAAKVDVLQNNHDSVLFQCLPDFRFEVGKRVQELMNAPLVSPRGECFNMKSGLAFGYNWKEMEEVK